MTICAGERELTSIEDSVDAWIQRLEDYIEKKSVYFYQKQYWQHKN